MSNLLISYADLPISDAVATPSSEEALFPVERCFTGGRDTEFRTAAYVTSSSIDFDNTTARNVDHYIITRAHRFTQKGVLGDPDFSLYADDNPGFSSPETETESVGTSDLVGPNQEDYITFFPPGFTTDYRYFRVEVDSGADSYIHKYSNVHIGTMFDLGRDPTSPAKIKRPYRFNERKPRYEMTLTWDGISNAKRSEFIDKIGRISDFAPVFLYDQANCFLNGFSLLHCRLIDYEFTPIVSQVSSMRATFREVI